MAKTWIKLYTEILSDPKMGRMSDKLFRRTIELFLLAGKEDGDGVLPSVDDIAWSLHSNPKDIQTTLDQLVSLKIVELKSETYVIANFAERQNSDLTRSEINRRYYENSKLRKSENQTEIQMSVRPDSDVAKSEIQTLEEEVEEEVEVEEELKRESREKAPAPKPAREVKQKYGQFGNVLLTPNEYAKLCERFHDADGRIEHFSKKKAAKGYTYKSDYAALLSWADDKAERAQAQVLPQPKKTYTFAEVGEMMERGEIPA